MTNNPAPQHVALRKSHMPSRRQFLTTAAAAVIGAPVATTLYTFFVEPHWLRLEHRDLPIANLPSDLIGKTLVQMSDLHIGASVSDRYIAHTFERVSALEPDFVVVTGDWITYDGPQQYQQLARLLESVPRGTLGSVGILGNHDYGHGWKMAEVAETVTQIATGAGIPILRNESRTFAGLRIIGFDDLWSKRFNTTQALADYDPNFPTIALSHNPDSVDLPGWDNYNGWILSGHTHGGQCKPPFLPPPMLPVQNRRYTSGEFALSWNRNLYINRGVGHLLEVRFNARPEVTVFRLVPDQESS